MMTVSDDAERTCPLCAEEMDLTDQQLRPCRCGYQICVWCWHHIIDLAEKEEMIGRCPACRTPYDKEKIVAMASNCERVVAKMNVEKKQKASKVKSKASADAKKHLTSVRVIQRNLVYIIGLPSHLCDESVLERKEYFGQYGKVLKVSISRPAGAQQASNNTFSVYITYSREEEAVRCIQSVHNYVLDGKTLRACFGTTKYCHAWLRNMTCNNPDCLYLHDIGSHEDSFTKDEIVSAYTRTRVPQIALSNSQRRSGSILPPPLDDFSILGSGSGKIQAKTNSNGASEQIRGSPPNSSTGKSAALPAAASWGIRTLNCQPSVPCTPLKLKAEKNTNSSLTSMLVENGKLISAWNDEAVNTSKVSDSSSNCLKSSAWHDEIAKAPKIPEKKGSASNKPAWHDEVIMPPKASRSKTSCEDEPSLSTSLMESSKLPSEWQDDKTASTPKAIDDNEESEVLSSKLEPLYIGSWKDFKVAVPSQEVSDNDFGLESTVLNDDVVIRSKQGEEKYPAHPDGMIRQLDPPRLIVNGNSRSSVSTLCKADLPCISEGSSCLPDRVSVSPNDNGHGPIQDNKIAPTNNHLILGVDTDRAGKARSEVSQTYSDADGVSLNLSLGLSSVNIDSSDEVAQPSAYQHQPLDTSTCANQIPNSKISGSTSDNLSRAFRTTAGNEEREFNSELPKLEVFSSISGKTDPVFPFGDGISRFPVSAGHSSATSWANDLGSGHPSPISVNNDWKLEFPLPLQDKEILISDGHGEGLTSSSVSRKIFEFPEQKFTEEKLRLEGVLDVADRSTSSELLGENNIISDILSLDFDPWDDSFSSNDLAKMLVKEQKEDGAPKLPNSWKPQNSNQSRFSFARQEIQSNLGQSLISDKSHVGNLYSSHNTHDGGFRSSQNLGNLYSSHNTHDGGFQTSPMVTNFEDLRPAITNSLLNQSESSNGTLKSKISAPPGFSTPYRPTPPGFSTHDRFNQSYDSAYTESSLHGGHLVGAHYQSHLPGNSGDFELSDPAIMMAVGKDQMPLNLNPGLVLKPTFPTHLSTSDSDPRLHLLMQQSLSSHQNMRLPDHIGDRYLSVNDSFIASQLLAQNHGTLSPFDQLSIQQPRNSHFSNSQWDGWSDFRAGGGDVHLGEMLRNDRYGLPNYYSGNDELKFRMPSGNIYNRAFGM